MIFMIIESNRNVSYKIYIFEQVDSGGPYSRLKDLVYSLVKENKIAPPTGILQPNFW